MPLSFAEETASVVAIDLIDRFRDAGTRLAGEKNLGNIEFLQADGTRRRFAPGSFDVVLSHAVIEHVADADDYPAQARRVLKPGGWMYLSTAPYLSFAGAHLPRLKVPIPLHLLLGRRNRLLDLPGPVAARTLDASRAGNAELVHQAGAAGRGEAGRSARAGARPPAAGPDRTCRVHHRP